MALIKCKECGNEVSTEASSCPKCGAKVKKSKIIRYGGGFIGIVILLILFGNIIYGPSSRPSQNAGNLQIEPTAVATSSATDNPTPVTPEVHPIEISAATLYAEYDANEIAADSKYKGKPLAVAGIVQSINKDFMDDPYIVIGESLNGVESIHAEFSKQSIDELMKLHKGDNVTITCTGKGKMVMFPVLDCKKT